MPPLEDDLRAALRRRPAPPGFAERLSARLGHESPNVRRPSPWWWRAAAVAAVLALIAFGVSLERARVERRNEQALRETLSALSIAAAQLQRAESRAFAPVRWQRLGALRTGTASPSLHSRGAAPRI